MEISNITNALGFTFGLPDKDDSGSTPAPLQDMLDISNFQLLADDEVDDVMDDTLNMIAQDNVAALSVHGGLNESRVFALLGL